MKLSTLVPLLALAIAPPAIAEACPYHDLMPEFSNFVTASGELAPPARAEAFVERFAAAHRDFYSEEMFGSRQKLTERAERFFDPQRAPKFQGSRPLSLDDVLSTGRTITADYARIEATFRKSFPDYRCDTPITFGISLYMFDGNQSADTPGKPQMRFGVDMISALHSARELPAFFHHELFHIYQTQQVGADKVPPDETQPVWWALWNEGLASYVSWKLNPTLTAPEIFWFPRDMEAQLQPKLAEAARLLLADLDGHDGYGRWFMGGENPPGLPSRSGYYLGYLMAKQLDHGDLAALARMPPQQVAVEARKFVESLAEKQ
ncbi:MAG TPA: DUF2268 domain-containing putative Zn-dependent protease [Steroidobacteraceae bacterium]|nr:DUF2268 domain-containing putative Zn-dependent protease [Steroidobacteraceae bacterium]